MPFSPSFTLPKITLLAAYLSSFTTAIPPPQTSPAPNKDGAPLGCSAQDFTNYCNQKLNPDVTHLVCDDLCWPKLAPGKPFDPVQCTVSSYVPWRGGEHERGPHSERVLTVCRVVWLTSCPVRTTGRHLLLLGTVQSTSALAGCVGLESCIIPLEMLGPVSSSVQFSSPETGGKG